MLYNMINCIKKKWAFGYTQQKKPRQIQWHTIDVIDLDLIHHLSPSPPNVNTTTNHNNTFLTRIMCDI